MSETRTPPPPLEPQFPLCGVCGNEVELVDDRFECENCQVSWPTDRIGLAAGRWVEPEAPQCESIDGRWLPGGQWADSFRDTELYRCALHRGHLSAEHEYARPDVHRSWHDKFSATAEQLASFALVQS